MSPTARLLFLALVVLLLIRQSGARAQDAAESANEIALTFRNTTISFTLPAEIGTRATSRIAPAGERGLPLPAYALFTLWDGTTRRGTISVLPVAEYPTFTPGPRERVDQLIALLAALRDPERLTHVPQPAQLEIGSFYLGRGAYLTFDGGSLFRYLHILTRRAEIVTNENLAYGAQGLTDDGQFVIAAHFAVDAATLPTDRDQADLSMFEELRGDGFFLTYRDIYYPAIRQTLHETPPEAFTPPLEAFDRLLQSLTIRPADR